MEEGWKGGIEEEWKEGRKEGRKYASIHKYQPQVNRRKKKEEIFTVQH